VTKLAAALVLAITIALPAESSAYYLTCGQATNLILNGSSQQQGIAVGHSTGVVDIYAGLICLAGGARCTCLANLFFTRLDAFSEAIATELSRCALVNPSEAAFGPALRAANTVCR
jgi:hypothetical protein